MLRNIATWRGRATARARTSPFAVAVFFSLALLFKTVTVATTLAMLLVVFAFSTELFVFYYVIQPTIMIGDLAILTEVRKNQKPEFAKRLERLESVEG